MATVGTSKAFTITLKDGTTVEPFHGMVVWCKHKLWTSTKDRYLLGIIVKREYYGWQIDLADVDRTSNRYGCCFKGTISISDCEEYIIVEKP